LSNVLSNASWIWCKGEASPRNSYLYARKTFNVPWKVKNAKAYITADSRYKLYINGIFLGRGPARCDPRWQSYDEYDITKHLYPGINMVAVLVHHLGEETLYCTRGRGGLLFGAWLQGEKGEEMYVVSDGSWKVKLSEAWDSTSPRLTWQLGFAEFYDSRKEPVDWNRISFDDSEWENATVIGKNPVEPWKNLEPRGIPPLREVELAPIKIDVGACQHLENAYVINLSKIFKLEKPDFRIAYAATYIHSERDAETMFFISAPAGIKFWINDKIVINYHKHFSPLSIWEGPPIHKVKAYLHRGWNKILIKIEQITPSKFSPWSLIFAITGLGFIFSPLKRIDGGPTWMVVGPFENPREEGRCLGFEKPIGPEMQRALDFQERYPNVPFEVKWIPLDLKGKLDPSISVALQDRIPPKESKVENPDGILHGRGKSASIQTAPSEDISILIDFGRVVTGYPRVRIDWGIEGAVMDISYREFLTDGRVIPMQWASPERCYADRYIMREGPQIWEPFEKRSFRYMQLTFKGCYSKPVKLGAVSIIQSTYPQPTTPHFQCSDPLLNKIWDLCRYCMEVITEDSITDCQSRERGQWIDNVWTDMFYCFYLGEIDIIRRALRQAAQCQDPDTGEVPPVPPSWRVCNQIEQNLWWVMEVLYYYQFTGDLELVKEVYPNMKKALAWFDNYIDEYGLLSDVPSGYPYVQLDYVYKSDYNKSDYTNVFFGKDVRGEVTILNCLYYEALRCLGEMAKLLGREDDAKQYHGAAERVKKTINDRLWSEEIGVYIDRRVGDEISEWIEDLPHGQLALSIVYDIAPRERWNRIVKHMLGKERPTTKFGEPLSMFWRLEALYRAGRDKEALDIIRKYFGWIIDMGATTVWEHNPRVYAKLLGKNISEFSKTEIFQMVNSHSHGFGCVPLYYLPAYILGVKPIAPNWNEVQVAPNPVDLTWAKGVIPTTKGIIEISWKIREDGGIDLNLALPKDCASKIILPKRGIKNPIITIDQKTLYAEGQLHSIDPRVKEIIEKEKIICIVSFKGGLYHLSLIPPTRSY